MARAPRAPSSRSPSRSAGTGKRNGPSDLARDRLPGELLGHVRPGREGRALGRRPATTRASSGWSGACTADPCVVTMSSAQTVVARFIAQDFSLGGDPEGRQGRGRGDEPPGGHHLSRPLQRDLRPRHPGAARRGGGEELRVQRLDRVMLGQGRVRARRGPEPWGDRFLRPGAPPRPRSASRAGTRRRRSPAAGSGRPDGSTRRRS